MTNLSLDRVVTVGVVGPFRRLFARGRQPAIPILMYHGIGNSLRGARHPYFETTTSPSIFARHLQQLRDDNYKPVTLRDAVRALGTAMSSQRLVAITFDDGLHDFYANALPLLEKYQFPATMFVVSGFVGSGDGEKQFMTWSELREVEAQGIQVGSHTVSHPKLWHLNRRDIDRELTESKRTIEDRLGKSIEAFSYPYAFPEQDSSFVVSVRSSLVRAGYDMGVSTMIGSARISSDPYFLPRIPVNSYDDARFLAAKLEGAYDWLHAPQLLRKSLLPSKRLNRQARSEFARIPRGV